jgi:uncharacterized surface protein with fasciclin (FAS1) repeats
MLSRVALVMALALAVAACGGDDDDDAATDDETTTTVAEDTTTTAMTDDDMADDDMADDDTTTTAADGDAAAGTIVDVAVADGRFTTLVEAVTAAGLAGTLSGEGPFTVFAPTDDAFAALPEGTLETVLADPEGQLTDILTHHVVAGALSAEDVLVETSIETLQGGALTVTSDPPMVNDANIVVTDVQASNGVIHVIDAVLLP